MSQFLYVDINRFSCDSSPLQEDNMKRSQDITQKYVIWNSVSFCFHFNSQPILLVYNGLKISKFILG